MDLKAGLQEAAKAALRSGDTLKLSTLRLLLAAVHNEEIKLRRELGTAVILITHNMEHVIELADRAVVLRQGRKVGELKPERANQQQLVSMIVGAET